MTLLKRLKDLEKAGGIVMEADAETPHRTAVLAKTAEEMKFFEVWIRYTEARAELLELLKD